MALGHWHHQQRHVACVPQRTGVEQLAERPLRRVGDNHDAVAAGHRQALAHHVVDHRLFVGRQRARRLRVRSH